MSSTRERDAFPKTLSRLTRLMFSSTEIRISQWESSVFVSPIKAPALMILDEYGPEERKCFSVLVTLSELIRGARGHTLKRDNRGALPAQRAQRTCLTELALPRRSICNRSLSAVAERRRF